MLTDWLLVRRLAAEIDALRGSRVRDAGALPDGRPALALWQRGTERLLCADLFAPTPVLTLETAELPIAPEPGFVRATGAALRGTVLTAAVAIAGERLLRLEFGTRSRFGVEAQTALIFELVPRFGNAVLVRQTEPDGWIVIAAAKEFGPSENSRRSVEAGRPYEPPPLRGGLATRFLSEEEAREIGRRPALDADLYVYRREGVLLQAHLVALPQFANEQCARASSLLDLLGEARARAERSEGASKRRRELVRLLTQRETKAQAQIARADEQLAALRDLGDLRAQGEAIYANLHTLTERERAQAKTRAAEIFAHYKKAVASEAPLQRRKRSLTEALDDLAQLRWDLENARDEDVQDLAAAIAGDPRARNERAQPTRKKRKPLMYELSGGSRAYVGRTPQENAELTFRLARPDDLWFHVRNQPGAHVILQRDDRQAPPQADVEAAAALAALHSKARRSASVAVDFTQRKHVRKRPSAAPGLVFYTNATSIAVSPAQPVSR